MTTFLGAALAAGIIRTHIKESPELKKLGIERVCVADGDQWDPPHHPNSYGVFLHATERFPNEEQVKMIEKLRDLTGVYIEYKVIK